MSSLSYNIIIITLLLGFLMLRANSRHNKLEAEEKEAFWSRESRADSVRRADISQLAYIYLDTASLPISDAEACGFSDIIKELLYYQDKKLLNLSAYSNTDLKLMYGPANLEALSECDNNFNQVIRLISKLAHKLLDAGRSDIARSFLEYNLSIGSDISSDYEALGRIYLDTDDTAAYDELCTRADAIESLSKDLIKLKLNNIKSSDK